MGESSNKNIFFKSDLNKSLSLFEINVFTQSRSQSMPVRGLLHNPRTGILWERECVFTLIKILGACLSH